MSSFVVVLLRTRRYFTKQIVTGNLNKYHSKSISEYYSSSRQSPLSLSPNGYFTRDNLQTIRYTGTIMVTEREFNNLQLLD